MKPRSILLSRFMASPCTLCGGRVTDSVCVCSSCLQDLPYLHYCCPQCGNPLNTQPASLCGSCQKEPPPVDRTFSLFQYKPPIDYLVKQLKFNHSIIVANLFGELMADEISHQNMILPEAIIAIPLHAKRLKQRGFNQALEIAKPLARKLNIPLLQHSLVRNKYTQPQTNQAAKKNRRKNLQNSFSYQATEFYQHIAIIDDVITTGATINEAAKTLKQNKIQQVSAWSCAHS